MGFGSRFVVSAVLIGSVFPVLAATSASATSAAQWHCSSWVRIDKKVEVGVRTCIAVTRPAADAPNVLVKGKFEVRNNTSSAKKVIYFPQTEGGSMKSPVTTSMGGGKEVKAAKHHVSSYAASAVTLPRSKMWIKVEYQLVRKTPAVRFQSSPHVTVGS